MKRDRASSTTTPVTSTRAGAVTTPGEAARAEGRPGRPKMPKKVALTKETPDDSTRAVTAEAPDMRTRAELVASPDAAAPPDEDFRKRVPQPDDRTPSQGRQALKRKVRMFYDLQRLRLQSAGRGMPKSPTANPIELHEVDVAILDRRGRELLMAEKNALRDVEDHLRSIPFYREVLSDKARFKGIGPTMAGVIMAEFDIHRQDTPSKMWAFAGLRPMPAHRCKACHSVVEQVDGGYKHKVTASRSGRDTQRASASREEGDTRRANASHDSDDTQNADASQITEDTRSRCAPIIGAADVYESGQAQRPKPGEKLVYNAFLRCKLVGVLGPVLLQVNSPWRKLYDDYKHRKASAGWGRSDAHRHQAAIRYMMKMLLLEIWREWRAHENLPVRASYQEEYLGHKHAG